MQRLYKTLLLLITSTLFYVSCNNEPDLIGLDLLPDNELLSVGRIDTCSIVAYTLREDSMITSIRLQNFNLLGAIYDPFFGKSIASIYTQISLPRNNFTFGENPVADSIVLKIKYAGIYGDTLYQHHIKVYELNDSLSRTKEYYSHETVAYKPEPLGSATFVPNLKTVDTINNAPVAPHLKIKLSQEFANKIVNAGAENLKNDNEFKKFLKGIYITSETVNTIKKGSMMYLNPLDKLSALHIYYHNNKDTNVAVFQIRDNCSRFGNFNHNNYLDAELPLQLQFQGDTNIGNELLYLQSMAGAKVKIMFPNLKEFAKSKKIAVNEAILELNQKYDYGVFKAPVALSLVKIDSAGKYTTLYDETIMPNYFGGKYLNGKYYFRISKYIQEQLLNPNLPDYGLMLVVTGAAINANRVVLSGPKSQYKPAKLIIYYSDIK